MLLHSLRSRAAWAVGCLGAVVLAAGTGCASYADRLAQVKTIEFNEVASGQARQELAAQDSLPGSGPRPADAVPFQEVDVLDDDAMSWSQIYAGMCGNGIVVFDANGDERPDIYVIQNGQNWTRPTDASGLLQDKPRLQANMLYLNQGNDANGVPRYRSIADLATANDTQVKAELLVEGFLFPRESTRDSSARLGRAGVVAVAADFDGDGRLDLLIGNAPTGMITALKESQRVVPAYIDPVGRSARPYRVYAPPFGMSVIHYSPRVSLHDTRDSARGQEPEGANTLYLNRGDSDGDGIPEWEDASRSSGVEGFRPTASLIAADFDLDGDLDIFCANYMDEDFSVIGSSRLAGGANEFFRNELAETGTLRFTECAAALNVDGVFDADYPRKPFYRLRRIPFMPRIVSLLNLKLEEYHPDFMAIDGVESEHAEISWAAVAQDVNHDGFPDIWVANDFGWLRLYLNDGGKSFRTGMHAREMPSGFWMSFAPADFNGDATEDLFAGNVGGVSRNPAIVNARPSDMFDPTLLDTTVIAERIAGKHDSTHVLIDGKNVEQEMRAKVYPSAVMPPDAFLTPTVKYFKNQKDDGAGNFDIYSLDPYEFAWGSTVIDVQNDGKPDLYWVGGMTGRPGSVTAMMGINPGRLLVNHGAAEAGTDVVFSDQTAEHHVFNIEEMKYDHLKSGGYVYRDAPKQNWSKRDVVYSFDRSAWSAQGPLVETGAVSQDMMQTAENGRAAIAADLNNDGYADLLLRNMGGYDSRRSNASNLKTRMADGQVRALPAHNNFFPSPTNFDPGRTRIFLNQYRGSHWLKVTLLDEAEGSANRFAVGARVVLNGQQVKVVRAGDGSYVSNAFGPLLFGLGDSKADAIRVEWPDRERSVTDLRLDGIADREIVISKQRGLVP